MMYSPPAWISLFILEGALVGVWTHICHEPILLDLGGHLDYIKKQLFNFVISGRVVTYTYLFCQCSTLLTYFIDIRL